MHIDPFCFTPVPTHSEQASCIQGCHSVRNLLFRIIPEVLLLSSPEISFVIFLVHCVDCLLKFSTALRA